MLNEYLIGSTVNSTRGTTMEDCGSAQLQVSSGPGRWYIAEGIGEPMVVFVNATFDVQLAVYEGQDCKSLTCLEGTAGLPPTYALARVTFGSNQGRLYYIFVSGFADAVGDFGLLVTEPVVVPNDQCPNATTIELDETIVGSTIFATPDGDVVADFCTPFNSSAPGIWYTTVGTGTKLQATISRNNFAAQLSVFAGNCESLTCVDGRVANLVYAVPPLVWNSIQGESYYILVHAVSGMAGEFDLYVTEARVPDNDKCAEAFELSVPTESFPGSTIAATLDDVDHCGT